MIDHPFGSHVIGLDKRSPAHLLMLRNTADLWTTILPHRTQIIYETDIATIIMNLRLRPGSVVAEAGTGSASLTHSLARTVAPNGKVFTFDFHKGRVEEAKAELQRHGLADIVVSGWGDVCCTVPSAEHGAQPSGFGLPKDSVDAVFLDVPSPWAALSNVAEVLRPGGMLCTFSPCIEQTQRLCNQLREEPNTFIDTVTVEALSKEFEPVKKHKGSVTLLLPVPISKGHSAYLTFSRKRLAIKS